MPVKGGRGAEAMQDLLVERPGPGWSKSLALRVVW